MKVGRGYGSGGYAEGRGSGRGKVGFGRGWKLWSKVLEEVRVWRVCVWGLQCSVQAIQAAQSTVGRRLGSVQGQNLGGGLDPRMCCGQAMVLQNGGLGHIFNGCFSMRFWRCRPHGPS